MVDILDEAREELKQENFNNIMKKYGPYAIGIVAAVLIGVSVNVWWKDYKANIAYESGAEYMTSLFNMRSLKIDRAIDEFEAMMDKNTPYSPLAALSVGAFAGFKQDLIKSSFVYNSIANNSDYDDNYRDYAKFLLIKTKVEANELDSKEAITALEKYINENSIFKFSALELLASLHISEGNKGEANEALNKIISDPQAPRTLKDRAEELSVLAM